MSGVGHELLVAALFDDPAAIEHGDLIGHAYRGKAVRYQDGDAIARQRAEMFEYLRLGARIHGRGRLIEYQNICVSSHERARQRDLLPLAAGPFLAVLEPFAELRLVAPRQLLDEVGGPPLLGRLVPAFLVFEVALVTGADILAHQHLI